MDLIKVRFSFPNIPSLPKRVRQGVKYVHKPVKVLIASPSKSTLKFLGCFKELSHSANVVCKFAALPDIIAFPLAVHEVITDLTNLFKKEALKDKSRAALNFIAHVTEVVEAVADSLELLEKFKVVGEKIVSWIPVFNFVTIGAGCISLGFALEKTKNSATLLLRLHKTVRDVEKNSGNKSEQERVLVEALDTILTSNLNSFRKSLFLSKNTDLQVRLQNLVLRVRSGESGAVDQAKEDFRILGKRARLQLGCAVGEAALKVTKLSGKIFLLTPAAPIVGCALLLTYATSSIVLWGGKLFFINKDPFSSQSHCKAGKAVHGIKKYIVYQKEAIKSTYIGKNTLQMV